MAYEIHVVRTRDWLDAFQEPITREEFDRMIVTDSELAWSATDYLEMRDEGGEAKRYYAITWKGESAFMWYRDQLTCSGATEKQIIKLVEIAKQLDAFVVGDDGEHYETKRTLFGGMKLVVQNG